ncbi:MAG: NDP-sugar synthase, partial [Pyrinomonadaceae bacterium]|nr:NDP-sugar synthase [Pyrinomonadaceae bacterium]
GSKYGVYLRYIVEPAPMGTAGAFKFAANSLKETTLVLNGDILTDLDLKEVIRQHQSWKAEVTIVLTPVENPSAYGLVEFDNDFRVLRFLEKPTFEEIKTLKLNTINAGIYILEPTILNLIPNGEKYSFEYQLFPNLLEKKVKFYAFVANDNYWLDIGTPQRYLQANLDLITDDSIIGKNTVIFDKAQVTRSIIGENVTFEKGAIIENSVIWNGAKIGANTKIIGSIIGHNSEVDENTCLENSMLSDGVLVNSLL